MAETNNGTVIIEADLDTKKVEKKASGLGDSIQKYASGAIKSLDKFGSSLTNKITKPAGIAAGALAGVVLAKGWARMTEIDNAKAKLRAVGNTAKGVESIMENATEAVKGTAYGLDEAATASASAVAAGIKPGKELTQYLTNTADAASVAGTSMGEMGNILNKVTTAGKAYTGDLNQLADRGLPIYQWLGDAAGKSAEEMQKAARKGQVSAQMVQDAIQNNIAGAAKEVGSTTITGAIANVGASIGRIGANFLGSADDADSFSGMVLPMLNNLMDTLGGAEDKAKNWGGTFANVIKGTIGYYKKGDSAIKKTDGSVKKILNTMKPVMSITKKMGMAFGNLGDDAKVKLVAGLVLAGPAIKVVTTAMKGAQKVSKGLNVASDAVTNGYKRMKTATVGTQASSLKSAIAHAKERAALRAKAQAILKATTAKRADTTMTNAQRQAMVQSEMATRRSAVAQTAYAAKTVTTTVVSRAATIGIKGLNTAMAFMGGPIGLIITGVSVLVPLLATMKGNSDAAAKALAAGSKASQNAANASKELATTYKNNDAERKKSISTSQVEVLTTEKQIKRITDLHKKENKNKSDKERLVKLVDQLNEAAGETVVKYNKETDSLSKTNKQLKDYIKNIKEKAQADAAASAVQEALTEAMEADLAIKENQKAYDKEKSKFDSGAASFKAKHGMDYDALGQKNLKQMYGEDVAKEAAEVTKAKSSMDNYSQAIADNTKIKEDATASVAFFEDQAVTQAAVDKQKQALEKMVKDTEFAGLQIPETLARSIAAGTITAPNTAEELKNLVNVEPAIQDARSKSMKIPNEISKGMLSGKYGVMQSAEDITKAIKFDGLEKKGAKVGKKTISAVKKSLAGGDISLQQAIDVLEGKIKFSETLPKKGKKAAQDTNKELEKETKKAPSVMSKNLDKIPTETTKAINRTAKTTKTATSKMIKGSKPTNVASTFKPIGGQITVGTASGVTSGPLMERVRQMIRDGLAAGRDEAKINSPSKLFRDKLGKSIPKGVAKGIENGVSYTKTSIKNLISKTAASVKNVSGNYASIGESFVNSYTKIVEKGQKKSEKSLDKYLDNRLKKIQKANKKEEKAAKKSGSKDKLKAVKKQNKAEEKAVKKANSKVTKQFSKAYSKRANKLTKQAEKNINAISEEYQEAYDKLISRRDALKDNLMSIDLGNKFEVTGLRGIDSGSLTGNLKRNLKDLTKYESNLNSIRGKVSDDLYALIQGMDVSTANKRIKKMLNLEGDALKQYVADWESEQKKIAEITNQQYKTSLIDGLEKDTEALRKYATNIAKIKGKIPESMLEEILGMDTSTANAYMDALNSMTTAEYNNYIAMWEQKEKYASSISTNLVKDDIAKLKADYETAMTKEMDKLVTSMKKLGKNVAKGFAKGMKSETKNLSKVVKGICNQVIKDTKKKFGIKSPSRVMAKIFKQVIQGGEAGTIKQAPKLLKAAGQTSDSFIEQFEKANIDTSATVARMQRTVIAETSRQPASVIKFISKMEDPELNKKVIAIEIKGGDIIIDGKVAGKQLSRFVDLEFGKTLTLKER